MQQPQQYDRRYHQQAASNLSNCQVYHVQIIETDASIRAGLKPIMFYRLVIRPNQIELEDNDRSLYNWPFKYIRRYGYTSNSFSLEAGSKCDTGEGLFIFRNRHSKSLYNQIIVNVSKIKKLKFNTDSFDNCSSSGSKEDDSRNSRARYANSLPLPTPHYELNGSMYAQVVKK